MQNKRSEGKSMRKTEEVELNQEKSHLIRFLFCFFGVWSVCLDERMVAPIAFWLGFC